MLVGFRGDANAAASAGETADFVLVEADGSAAQGLRANAGELPLGLILRNGSGAAKELREAGIDFIAIEPDTPAAVLLDDDMGYVFVLPEQPEELLLRSLEPLSFEALYLPKVSSPLTVARQIELSRVAAFTRKPLICQVGPNLTSEDLQCLRAAGVIAVVVDGQAEGIAALKETVASLPVRKVRRDERPVVSLPRGQMPQAEEDDDDDDEP
jgi:hypothetical protein